jgi:hypothetical protein
MSDDLETEKNKKVDSFDKSHFCMLFLYHLFRRIRLLVQQLEERQQAKNSKKDEKNSA